MTVPNEIWYALGGLATAILAQRFGLPVAFPRKGGDLRQQIRDTLLEILQVPAPAPVKASTADDDAVRRRLQEVAQGK
jgi:hypothetical protein